jgi:hypothetical protein
MSYIYDITYKTRGLGTKRVAWAPNSITQTYGTAEILADRADVSNVLVWRRQPLGQPMVVGRGGAGWKPGARMAGPWALVFARSG